VAASFAGEINTFLPQKPENRLKFQPPSTTSGTSYMLYPRGPPAAKLAKLQQKLNHDSVTWRH
jgi:hypothetical protein